MKLSGTKCEWFWKARAFFCMIFNKEFDGFIDFASCRAKHLAAATFSIDSWIKNCQILKILRFCNLKLVLSIQDSRIRICHQVRFLIDRVVSYFYEISKTQNF